MKIRMTKTVVRANATNLQGWEGDIDDPTGLLLIGLDAAVLVAETPAKGRQKAVVPQYETR